MLPPTAIEWDEYFSLCEESRKPLPPDEKHALAILRCEKIHHIRTGTVSLPRDDEETLFGFLIKSQLSDIVTIVNETGLDHSVVKEIFFRNRDRFFVIRADADGDGTVRYAAAEPKILARPAHIARVERRKMVARWMRIKGFIDVHTFHEAMSLKQSVLNTVLKDMGYSRRIVQFGDKRRLIYFEG